MSQGSISPTASSPASSPLVAVHLPRHQVSCEGTAVLLELKGSSRLVTATNVFTPFKTIVDTNDFTAM